MRRQLTDVSVRKIAPPASGRIEVFDQTLPWLALRITSNGARSYVVRARIKGRAQPIRYTLGDARLLTLADARQRSRDVLLKMQAGVDPREEKRTQDEAVQRRKRLAFNIVAEAYIKDHVARLRSSVRTAADIRRFAVKAWGDRSVSSISTDDIAELIAEIAKDTPAMGDRLLQTLKGLFRWASSAARPRDERLERNPAANLTSRDFNIKTKQPDEQVELSADHVRAIWNCSVKLGEPYASYFRMLMLSGQRRMEIGGLRWDEVDFNEGVVIFPASRMKAGRSHELPLTGAMIKLLQSMPQTGPYVFGGQTPMGNFDRLKRRLDTLIEQAVPGLKKWTLHDIRRAVRTGLGAIQQVPHDVAELVVAHVPPALTRTYNLHGYRDEKRAALELWGQRLMRIVEPPAGNVVALGAAR